MVRMRLGIIPSVAWTDWHAYPGTGDPSLRGELAEFAPQGGAKSAAGKAIFEMIERAHARRQDPEATRRLEENVVGGPKGWLAHGATNGAERGRTLDLLGFEKQLVFATFSIDAPAPRQSVQLCPRRPPVRVPRSWGTLCALATRDHE